MGNITLIGNQPIIFNQADNSCGCPEISYQQVIDQTDITSMQFLVDPCPGIPNIICNSDFDTQDCWTILKGWTITGGLAIKETGTSGTLQYLNATEVGKLYQVVINVKTLIGTLEFMSGSQLIKQITTPGYYKFNFESTALYIQFFMSGNNNDYCELDSVTLFPLSENLAWGIIDSNGDTVSKTAYQEDPSSFCFAGNHVTVNINWADLGQLDGCYTIGLTNGCLNTCGQAGVPNGSFNSGSYYWDETITSGTPVSTFIGTQLNVTGTTGDSVEFLNNKLELCAGVEYSITVDVLKLLNSELTIQMGTQTQTTNVEGVQTFFITSDGTDLTLIFDMLGGTSQLYLGSVEIAVVNSQDYTFDYISNPIKLVTGSECDYKLLAICNNDDAWGFAFEGSCFFPKIRVEASLTMGSYPNERELNEFNNGFRQIQWAESRKIRSLNVSIHPEYVYDFLRFAPVADHFYIDNTEYISEDDEINVQVAADVFNSGTMTLNVSETQALYNVNKGNEFNGCDPPGQLVVEKPTGDSITEPDDLSRLINP
jgi:hypothetical protein